MLEQLVVDRAALAGRLPWPREPRAFSPAPGRLLRGAPQERCPCSEPFPFGNAVFGDVFSALEIAAVTNAASSQAVSEVGSVCPSAANASVHRLDFCRLHFSFSEPFIALQCIPFYFAHPHQNTDTKIKTQWEEEFFCQNASQLDKQQDTSVRFKITISKTFASYAGDIVTGLTFPFSLWLLMLSDIIRVAKHLTHKINSKSKISAGVCTLWQCSLLTLKRLLESGLFV